MSKRRHPVHRQPSRKEEIKIIHRGFSLDELFDEAELLDLIAVARLRIIGEFFYATDFTRGRRRSTDNYIVGIGHKPKDLAAYVNRSIHNPFVIKEDLPTNLQDLHPSLIEKITVRAQYDVMLVALQSMQYREIWYDDALGIWQVCQSSMDDYRQCRSIARQVKYDRRHYHGRVRSQSKARCIPPGTSIGFS